MHKGELLMAGANVLGPWFARAADNAVFTWEQIQASGSAALAVTIWHKNRGDIGPGDEITTAWTSTGNFRYLKVEGLKELVRFEFTVSSNIAVGTVTVDNVPSTNALDITAIGWVMYRMLEPSWFDTAAIV